LNGLPFELFLFIYVFFLKIDFLDYLEYICWMEVLEKLKKQKEPLEVETVIDEFTKFAEKAFDCEFNGKVKFYPWEAPTLIPKEFNIGVIYGGSGSGKSTLLKKFGKEEILEWDQTKSIVSHFDTPDDALDKLGAVGLNSIPSWYKPHHVLSNGEKFRAELARKIKNGAVIDEFTSVIDRNVAKAASVAISKYIKRKGIKNIVLATCHEDILEWLEPDWVVNTNSGEVYAGNFSNAQISISKYIQRQGISGPCLKNITI